MSTTFFMICTLVITSCSNHTKKDYSTDIAELNKQINLKIQPSTVKWKKVELSSGRNSNSFRIYASLTYDNLDSLIMNAGGDMRNDIYIDKKVVNYSVAKTIKNSVYLEDNYYRLNTAAYSISAIVKNPFLTGYFFRTDENQLFIVVQLDSNSGI